MVFCRTDSPQYTVNDTFSVVEGEPFFLELTLQGNPLPTDNDTDWFLNGRLLFPLAGIDFGADFISLQIATRLDQGNYIVTTSNRIGSANASFQLLVESNYKCLYDKYNYYTFSPCSCSSHTESSYAIGFSNSFSIYAVFNCNPALSISLCSHRYHQSKYVLV